MNSRSALHVFMCVDQGFTMPLAVSLASLDANCGERPVHVFIAHPGLTQVLRDKVTRTLATLTVEWVNVDEHQLQGAHFPDFLSRASLYRLLVGSVLPEDIRRVLYLDADTAVADSLSELFDTEIHDGNVVAAVREAQSPWAAGPLGPPWRQLGLEPSSAYFNSGMMLIDLERWRSRDVGHACLDLLRRVKPRWGDQDGLNTILENAWQELPRRWNVQSADIRGDSQAWAMWPEDVKLAVTSPAIVHYTERDKPWKAGSQHPELNRWLGWLDETSWAGWRPEPAQRGWWESLARAAVRSVRETRSRRSELLPE
jgi:lipopolysaccharide biosynthesis glycosyltransferase